MNTQMGRPKTTKIQKTARPEESQAEGKPLLTKREEEIAQLVADGRTNGEIAALLGLSQSTVKNRLVRIYDKVGVNTRAELASRMARGEV
jgi:non-specific serine/threonine protein kinase